MAADGTMKDGAVDNTAALADSVVTAAKIANRTRTFFVPCISAYDYTLGAQVNRTYTVGWPLEITLNKVTYAVGNFIVPSDFASTMTVKAVMYTGSSGNCYGYLQAQYGAAGENYTAHSGTTGSTTAALTANQIGAVYELSLSSAAVGDYVFLTLQRDSSNASDTVEATIYLIGFLVSYTADS